MKRMRQRITLVLLTVFIAVLLSGCVKFDTSITIKSNGRIDLDVIYAVDTDMKSYLQQVTDSIDEIVSEKSNLAAIGIDCKDYNEGDYSGIRLTGKNIKLSEDFESEFSDYITYERDGKKVSVTAFRSALGSFETDDDTYSAIASAGGSANVRVTFPKGTEIVNSNATSVSNDGLTLTWDLLSLSPNEGLRVDFEMPTTATVTFMAAFIGGIVGAIVIIVIVAVLLVKYNKKQKAAALAGAYAAANPVNTEIPAPQNVPQTTEETVTEQTSNESENIEDKN